jgi:hypothetical protein
LRTQERYPIQEAACPSGTLHVACHLSQDRPRALGAAASAPHHIILADTLFLCTRRDNIERAQACGIAYKHICAKLTKHCHDVGVASDGSHV